MFRTLFAVSIGLLMSLGSSARTVAYKNHINSIAMSKTHIVWADSEKLYLSTPEEFPKYTTQALPAKFRGNNRLAWSGNGKVLYMAVWGRVIRYSLTTDGTLKQDAVFVHKQITNFILTPNTKGDRVVVTFDGERTAERWPGWRAAVELQYDGKELKNMEFLSSKEDATVITLVLRDKDDRLYFAPKESNRRFVVRTPDSKVKPLFEGSKARLQGISPDGKHLLFNARSPEHKSRDGSQLWTLYVAKITNGKVGQLEGILLPHTDHILWGGQFVDDNTIMWRHLIRGKDGNKIVKRQIKTCTCKDGKWGPHRVEFEIPNIQVWGMGITDKFIVTLGTNGLITLYDRTKRKAKPRSLKLKL